MDIITLADLRTFMLKRLGNVGVMLGYNDTEAGQLHEPAIDTLLFFETSDPATITNTAQLRALAVYNALSTALVDVATYYDFSADNSEYKRSQLYRQVKEMLSNAEAAVVASGIVATEIYITDVVYND